MNQRVFTAVDLPDPIKKSVRALQQEMSNRFPPIIRWTPSQQMHITLKFVGAIKEDHLTPIKNKLHEECGQHPAFPLILKDTGIFPSLKNPRIFWIGLGLSPELLSLVKRNERVFNAFGYPPEKRPFRGHITIGRFKKYISLQELKMFQTNFQAEEPSFHAKLNADHLSLYESQLSPQGPTYTQLLQVPFRDASA